MKHKNIEKLDVSSLTTEKLAHTIDHAVLKPNCTQEDIEKGCQIALKYNVATVCVKPCHVKLCAKLLRGSEVKVAAVIGFPLGGHLPQIKAAEASKAVEDGAEELDMVINIGAMKEGNHLYVKDEIEQVVEAAKGALVKVILETCYLTEEEKIKGCKLSEEAGAVYVKTSTGFGPEGAKVEDVELMYRVVAPRLGVKAAGGIRNLERALRMLQAGATRLGTSSTEIIMKEWTSLKSRVDL